MRLAVYGNGTEESLLGDSQILASPEADQLRPWQAGWSSRPRPNTYVIPCFNGWPIFRDGRTKKKTLDFRPDTDNEDPTGQYLSRTETRFKACLVAFRSITPPLEGRDPVTASLVTSLNMPPFRWIFSFSRIVLTVG